MNQQQKDTIREEQTMEKINQIFRKSLATHKPIQDIAVDMYKAGMIQGAKDKVEDIILEVRKALASEGVLSMSVEKRLETLLKDNT